MGMRRETRLVLALGVVAIVGLSALSYLADQYKKRAGMTLAAREAPAVRAARIAAALAILPDVSTPEPSALAAAGISLEEYDVAREAYAAWARGETIADQELASAFAARSAELAARRSAR